MRGSRNRLSEAVISALLRDFSKHGGKAIAKVRRTHPAAYLKCLVLLVPREHKVEQSNPLKAMSDEELDEAIAALRQLLADREAAAQGQLIDAEPVEPAPIGPPLDTEGTAEPATIPAPALTDEQIDATLDALREITRGVRRRAGENVTPVALSAPEAQSPEATPEPTQKHKTNRLMREADTAVGPRERKPRVRKVPSPAST